MIIIIAITIIIIIIITIINNHNNNKKKKSNTNNSNSNDEDPRLEGRQLLHVGRAQRPPLRGMAPQCAARGARRVDEHDVRRAEAVGTGRRAHVGRLLLLCLLLLL